MSTVDPRAELVTACHILAAEGHEHFFLGHVSARVPGRDGHMFVKPTGMGLADISVDDVIVVDFDGRVVEGRRRAHHEMPIHIEIYRRRPDIECVVHTHPPAASAFTASHAEFAFVSQDSALFAEGLGHYAKPQLVVTAAQGRELAEALGSRKAVLLANHGIAVGGASIRDATFLAVSLERSLRVQLAATQFGGLVAMAAADVHEMADYFGSAYGGRVDAAWAYLRGHLHKQGANE